MAVKLPKHLLMYPGRTGQKRRQIRTTECPEGRVAPWLWRFAATCVCEVLRKDSAAERKGFRIVGRSPTGFGTKGYQRISPSWSTARHRYNRLPAIRTTISSRCQSVARTRPALPQLAGDQRTKFQHPAPHRFVGNVQPTLGQEILHVPVAEREAQVQPDRVLDDRRREPMAAIRE